jgi:hypothetical protein
MANGAFAGYLAQLAHNIVAGHAARLVDYK